MSSTPSKNVVDLSLDTITAIENVVKTSKLYPNKSRRLSDRVKTFQDSLANLNEKALASLLERHILQSFLFLLKEILAFLTRFSETQYLLKSYSNNIDLERFHDLNLKVVEFSASFTLAKTDNQTILLEDAQDKKEDDLHHHKVLEGLKADNAKAVLGGIEAQEAKVVESLPTDRNVSASEIEQIRQQILTIDTDFDNYNGSIDEDDIASLECDRTHVQKIGEGKFGIVFKGQLYGAEVAVKYLRDAVIPADRHILIRKEIAKLQLLKHENIVKYFGAQTKSTPYFFVFEKAYCSLYSALYARDESEKLALSKTNYRKKLEILIDCARAIEYLHSVNVLHRNIKSTNILITSNGTAKICDFSFAMNKQDLASLLSGASVRASITGTGVNLNAQKTYPAYLAPEVVLHGSKDAVEYNIYTDVYAFGILLNEVLAHAPPFPGLTFRNIMNKLQKSDNNRPLLFAQNHAENQGNSLTLELRSLVERAWATNPLDRPAFTHIVLILERVYQAEILTSALTVEETSKSNAPLAEEAAGTSNFNARKSFYQRSGGNDNAESMYDMGNDTNDLSFSRDAGDLSPVKANKISTIIESYEKGLVTSSNTDRNYDKAFDRSLDHGDANTNPSVFVKLYDKFEKNMDRSYDTFDKSKSFDRSRSDNRASMSISKSMSIDRRGLQGIFEPTLEVEADSNDQSDLGSVTMPPNPPLDTNKKSESTPLDMKSVGIAIDHTASIDSKASLSLSKSHDSPAEEPEVSTTAAEAKVVLLSTTTHNYLEVNQTRTLDSFDSNAPRGIIVDKSKSIDSVALKSNDIDLRTQSVESIAVDDAEYTHSKYIAQLFYDAGSCGKKESQTKLEDLAAREDLLALGFLMGMLCYGSGMPKDVKKANEIALRIYPSILQRADNENDSSRKFYQYIAGLCYEQGVGIEKNDELAVKYYQMSADQGYAAALSNLGYCYKHGQGVKEDRYEAVRLYGLGADQNHATSLNNLGYCYQHGYGVQKDLQEAVRLYKRSADQGHSTAQNNLGYCYQYGQGCEKNLAEAVRLYELSASQGCSFGQNSLGHCYKRGHGVPKDYSKAVYYYRLSAEQGHATAQNNLGYCYQYGQGVDVNYGEAVRWYKLSVEQGQASAENNLGFCYQCGIGVKKDLPEAVRLYKSSSEKGYAVAMYNLGLCYLNGMGVSTDAEKAVQLIRSSAEQGHTAGQVKLAMCYEEGVGVPKETREAIRWYVQAARRGDETAMKALKRIHG